METSLSVQPDDMTGNHRDGEQNPLEQPQTSEEEDKVVADGISHPDQGGKFCVQAEVGMDLKIGQVAARHFVLAIIRQQRGTTEGAQVYVETTLFDQTSGGTRNNTTSHRSSGCETTDGPATTRDGVHRAKQTV